MELCCRSHDPNQQGSNGGEGDNIAGCELRGQELGNRAVVAKAPSPRGPEERVNIYFRYGTASLVCRRKLLEWGWAG